MAALTLEVAEDGEARLFCHGLPIPGLRRAVANPGGDVLLVLAEPAVTIRAARSEPPAPLPLRLATDGQA